MDLALRVFYRVLALVATAALCILAYWAVHSLLKSAPSGSDVVVDYNVILTVLLTTVTVIFTVCAIVLAILGIFGFRNLKREAGRYAEAQALAEIAKAFGPDGNGTRRIESEMQSKDGPHRKFVEKRIRTGIIELFPIIVEKINAEALSMAFDEPTDEGDVE